MCCSSLLRFHNHLLLSNVLCVHCSLHPIWMLVLSRLLHLLLVLHICHWYHSGWYRCLSCCLLMVRNLRTHVCYCSVAPKVQQHLLFQPAICCTIHLRLLHLLPSLRFLHITIWILWIWIRLKYLILTCQHWFNIVFVFGSILHMDLSAHLYTSWCSYRLLSIFLHTPSSNRMYRCGCSRRLHPHGPPCTFGLSLSLMSLSLKSHGASNTLLLGGVTTNVLGNTDTVMFW